MILKCVKNKVENFNWSKYLKIGKQYQVIEIYIRIDNLDSSMSFRIIDEVNGLGIFTAECFEVVDKRLNHDLEFLTLSPFTSKITFKEFSKSNFWNDFFDGNVDAKRIFERVMLENNFGNG